MTAMNIGDDMDDVTLLIKVGKAPLNFSTASLVRWWMVAAGATAPAFTPKTLTNTGLNAWATGTAAPVLSAAETAALAATDYKVFVEVTMGGKIKTYTYTSFTFETRRL